MTSEKLDNPAWHSLAEVHRHLALDYGGVKFYRANYCPFGGFIEPKQTEEAIHQYADLTDNFFVIGEKPNFEKNIILKNELICKQMVLTDPVKVDVSEQIVVLQSPVQKTALFDLVSLVQPGYFRPDTSDLGNYFGIYKNDMLVAVTGERMKMNSFSEISAVVTHPEHTGRGYAKELMTHTSNLIFAENKVPYLHVTRSNIHAIALYEKLGFRTRREISFWHLQRAIS